MGSKASKIRDDQSAITEPAEDVETSRGLPRGLKLMSKTLALRLIVEERGAAVAAALQLGFLEQ
jgi:hypothetical protein